MTIQQVFSVKKILRKENYFFLHLQSRQPGLYAESRALYRTAVYPLKHPMENVAFTKTPFFTLL